MTALGLSGLLAGTSVRFKTKAARYVERDYEPLVYEMPPAVPRCYNCRGIGLLGFAELELGSATYRVCKNSGCASQTRRKFAEGRLKDTPNG